MYQKFAKPPFDLTEIAKFSWVKEYMSDYIYSFQVQINYIDVLLTAYSLAKTADFEDNDSRFSFSNSSSSPPMPVSMCWRLAPAHVLDSSKGN